MDKPLKANPLQINLPSCPKANQGHSNLLEIDYPLVKIRQEEVGEELEIHKLNFMTKLLIWTAILAKGWEVRFQIFKRELK